MWMTFLQQLGGLALDIGPLLVFGLSVAGLLHLLVTEETVLRHLGKPGWLSVLRSTLFAVPLPLCSCSVVPVAASLRRKGASDGATVSFLIAAPQIGADSYLLTQGLLGPFFAIYRLLTSLLTALFAGLILDLSRIPLGRAPQNVDPRQAVRQGAWREFRSHVEELVASLANNLLVGLLLATLILVLLPDGWLASWQGHSPWISMFAMLAIGLPLYVCATASTPIAAALVLKGLHPGAALVFLLAGPATNMVTMVMLKGSLGWRALGVYLGTISVMALAAGWLLGFLKPDLAAHISHVHEHGGASWYEWAGAALMGFLLLQHYSRVWLRRRKAVSSELTNLNVLELMVSGMTCAHCAGRVESAARDTQVVDVLSVDPGTGLVQLRILDGHSVAEVRRRLAAALQEAGYDLVDDPSTDS
jgi:uncharacterized membrane protein YraQ (UPF0718 family)/copper chaperone CopZ